MDWPEQRRVTEACLEMVGIDADRDDIELKHVDNSPTIRCKTIEQSGSRANYSSHNAIDLWRNNPFR